jgi:hypothetical protein
METTPAELMIQQIKKACGYIELSRSGLSLAAGVEAQRSQRSW